MKAVFHSPPHLLSPAFFPLLAPSLSVSLPPSLPPHQAADDQQARREPGIDPAEGKESLKGEAEDRPHAQVERLREGGEEGGREGR